MTDKDGHYSALSLNPGKYRVTVTRDGFKTEVRTGIVLTVGREEVSGFVANGGICSTDRCRNWRGSSR